LAKSKETSVKSAYSGRWPGIVPKSLSLSRHAAELLFEMVPTPKTQGAFVSTLIESEFARREERRRMRELLAPVLAAEVTDG
jgi:hypothetical protein